MHVIEPYYHIEPPAGQIDMPTGRQILMTIERAARTCYKSEHSVTGESAEEFVRRLKNLGHHSVIEHTSLSVRFVVDRGVTHELVRHRLCAFSQESTRYCNYRAMKYGTQITVIRPLFWHAQSEAYQVWYDSCWEAEQAYMKLLADGAKPQEARSVLPNSLKTEIVVTANLREWMHILRLRTSEAAHPQMRQVMTPLLQELQGWIPVLFEDIEPGHA